MVMEMFECYEIVLKNYVVNSESGEKFLIEEPIAVEHTFDRRFGGTPIIISRMLDEAKAYIVARMDGEQDGQQKSNIRMATGISKRSKKGKPNIFRMVVRLVYWLWQRSIVRL